MEASVRPRSPRRSPREALSSPRGSRFMAIAAAVLAGILIFAFVSSRKQVAAGPAGPARVLVAKALIPAGSSGAVVAGQQLVVPTTFNGGQVKPGAIADPAILRGQVATTDIYPGQQITASDFKASKGGITSDLTGAERAVAVPVDAVHGLLGNIAAGDRVDVLVGFAASGPGATRPVLRTLMRNVLVLSAGATGGGGASNAGGATSVVLRVTQPAQLAFAADNGRIWLVLRPPVGAQQPPPSVVTLESLLAGATPIPRAGG